MLHCNLGECTCGSKKDPVSYVYLSGIVGWSSPTPLNHLLEPEAKQHNSVEEQSVLPAFYMSLGGSPSGVGEDRFLCCLLLVFGHKLSEVHAQPMEIVLHD